MIGNSKGRTVFEFDALVVECPAVRLVGQAQAEDRLHRTPRRASQNISFSGRKRSEKEYLNMAYAYTNSKDRTYILHSKTTVLKNGREQTIYFFGKEEKEGALDAVPDGYVVSESKNGLPVLKRAPQD